MKTDIRIDLAFFHHRKTKRLIARLGLPGVWSLLNLWARAAQTKPKGEFAGMDEQDIALDAEWTGDPEEFCCALQDTGWLDRNGDGVYRLHDWQVHQPWVYHAQERSQAARENAEKRWARVRERKARHKEPVRPACDPHNRGTPPAPNPPPAPSPNHKKERYGSFVLLTADEYRKLCAKFTQAKADDYIDALDNKIGQNEQSYRKKYKDDYRVLLTWQRSGWLEPGREARW